MLFRSKDIASAKIDIGNTEEKIAHTEILEAQLLQEQAQLDAETERLALYDSRKAIVDSKAASIAAEAAGAATQLTGEALVNAAELSNMAAQAQLKLDAGTLQEDEETQRLNHAVDAAQNRLDIVTGQRPRIDSLTDSDIDTIWARQYEQEEKYEVDLEFWEKILSADIIQTLRHSIGTT